MYATKGKRNFEFVGLASSDFLKEVSYEFIKEISSRDNAHSHMFTICYRNSN